MKVDGLPAIVSDFHPLEEATEKELKGRPAAPRLAYRFTETAGKELKAFAPRQDKDVGEPLPGSSWERFERRPEQHPHQEATGKELKVFVSDCLELA